jgi:hemerythrin-like domain-containing protein
MGELHRTRGEAIEGKPRPVPPLGRLSVEQGEAEAAGLSPAELLGLEHDVIRRVMVALERQLTRIGEEERVDAIFLATVVDFIDTYADRVHHGKEEGILFRLLHQKSLSAQDRQMMEELAREHVEMRRIVGELRRERKRYAESEEGAADGIADAVGRLLAIYPPHMESEDEVFFPAAMDYLDEGEQKNALEEMKGHDRAMIHEKYGSVAEALDARTEDWELRE